MRAISTGYVARPQFVEFHKRTQRWAIAVCHRRAGKTVAAVNDLIDDTLRAEKPESRFAYVAPTYVQAKDIAWEYSKRFTSPLPGVTFNESELRIDIAHNGARIRLYGADNYDRMRGLYFDAVVLDEYGDMDPRAWTEVIRPALADRKGRATFIGTPRGDNHFAARWNDTTLDQFKLMLRASETGIIDAAELADAKSQLSEEQYSAEFECSFAAGVVGAYYARELANAERDGRIGSVGWEPSYPVHTAWDLGVGDSTAIWMAQIIGTEIRLIDYVENSGQGLAWYVNALRERPYMWGDHVLPHDAEVTELGTGERRVDTLRKQGLGSLVVNTRVANKEDTHHASRLFIPRCWFDAKKCARGLAALRNYRREWDEKRKVFHDRPLHDWASHGADAFGELAKAKSRATKSAFGRKLDIPNLAYA